MHAHSYALFAFVAVVASTGASACGPKLDPVEVTTDNADTSNDTPTGATGGGNTPAGTGGSLCGTNSATIGYAAQAQAVVSKNCALSSCHGAGGQTPNMTDYASTKAGISGGGLDEVNNGGMPIGRTLTANEKCILQAWAKGSYAP